MSILQHVGKLFRDNPGALQLAEGNGSQFIVNIHDALVGYPLRAKGSYGKLELKRLEQLVDKNSTCLFLGAHIGAIAIPISRKIKTSYLVEANPDTFELLQANVAINKLSNVHLYNFAAGESNGEIKFVQNPVDSWGSKREPLKKEKMYYNDNPKTITVPMKALDEEFKVIEFELVFMDIEGSEYFALMGMQSILKSSQSLVIEFLRHHLDNVSGVSIEEFLGLIEPHFNFLHAPSLNITVEKEAFYEVLKKMYEESIPDDGLIFSKKNLFTLLR